jgi:hypothetical protein
LGKVSFAIAHSAWSTARGRATLGRMLSLEDRQRFTKAASRYLAQIERIEFKQPQRGVIAPDIAALADPQRDALFEVIQDLRTKYGNDIVFYFRGRIICPLVIGGISGMHVIHEKNIVEVEPDEDQDD